MRRPRPRREGEARVRPIPVSPTNHEVRIGARLRAARQAHGFTLDQLAGSAGLTKGFLSRVERDETSLSVASLITLCEVMSIEVGSLFTAPDVALVRRDEAPSINLGAVMQQPPETADFTARLSLYDGCISPFRRAASSCALLAVPEAKIAIRTICNLRF